jgi:putative sigma-54 modulation protein
VDIRFSGKGLRIMAGMKEHAEEKLLRLERYAPRLVEAHVILKMERYLYIAEVTLLAKNFRAYGEGQAKDNVYAAIDQAYDRILKQLKRYREKVKDHHKGLHGAGGEPPKVSAARKALAAAARAPGPEILKMDDFAVKPMSVEEASMQLKLSADRFLVFSNASTNHVNVIFKRDDGNHGLIEPGY